MKIQRRQLNRNRRGFTLMELLLVMAILVIMASMVGFAFLNMQQGAQEDATRSQISTLKSACKQYKLHVGRFPNELNDLLTAPSGLPAGKWRGPYLDTDTIRNNTIVDTWGGTYQYAADEAAQRVTIISPGQDGTPNTNDDIPPPEEQKQTNS